MAPHSAHRPGRQSLPAASTTGRRTSAVRRRRRTGPALARPARTRGGADPGAGTSSKDPMQAIVGPRHAGKPSGSTHIRSGLSSTPAGQARGERRVQGSLGLALRTLKTPKYGQPPVGQHRAGRRGCAPRPRPEPITRGEAQHPNSGIPSADSERPTAMPIAQVTGRRSACSGCPQTCRRLVPGRPPLGWLSPACEFRSTGRDRHFGSKPVPGGAWSAGLQRRIRGEAPVRLPPQSR